MNTNAAVIDDDTQQQRPATPYSLAAWIAYKLFPELNDEEKTVLAAGIDSEHPSPTTAVVERYLAQKQVSVSQRAALSALMIPLLAREQMRRLELRIVKRRRVLRAPDYIMPAASGWALREAARLLGIATSTVQKAVIVLKRSPAGFERVRSGESTTNVEYRLLQPGGHQSRAAARPHNISAMRKRGEFAKKRMLAALSSMSGVCRGLAEIEARVLDVMPLDAEARREWAQIAFEAARDLRACARKLLRTMPTTTEPGVQDATE